MITFDRIAASLSGEPKQALVLTRHFFNRLFQNDIFPFQEQMKEKLAVILAMIAALGWLMADALLLRYVFVADHGESWLEKCHFLAFFMVLLAFATLLEWDVIFLDKRDHSNLMVLPVRTRTLIYSKSVAMAVFIVFYTAAVCSLSFIVIAFVLPGWISNGLGTLALYFAAHVLSSLAAFTFVFLLFVAVQAILLLVLSPRLFKTISLVVRFGLAVVCIFLLMTIILNRNSTGNFFSSLAALKERGDVSILLFPPMWFAGIYESILGRHDPLYSSAVSIGIAAILILGLAYFLALALSYKRHVRKSLEVRSKSIPLKRAKDRLSAAFDAIVLKDSTQRAVFHFFGRTLRNSALHKVRLAGYLAFALGLILVFFGARRDSLRDLSPGNLNLLVVPLILAVFLLLGIRSIVNVPLAAESNWIFRLTERESRKPYFIGLKKAILCYALLPLFAVLFVFYAPAWGAWPALLHVLYGLAFALLLTQFLFWNFRKIPFSCVTVPGRARLQYLWLVYGLTFIFALSAFSSLERTLFKNPAAFLMYLGAAFGLVIGLDLYQRAFIYEKLRFLYEDKPDPVMVTLVES